MTPAELDGPQRALYDAIAGGARATGPQHFALTRDDGSLRGPFNALLLSPGLGEAVQQVGAAIRYSGSLDARSREMAILLVAARWDSAFEREAHEAVGRAAGLSDDEIAALRREDTRAFDGAERVVAETARELAHGDLSDDTWTRAVTMLGREQVFELTVLVGYYAMLALQLRAFRVAP
ncbi:carboxymuconolactone decarboxylase family protein [Microbacterium sp. NPDC077184]|uniref:carboxymuconolactone decarboxylase family protein n=1 Tax=Microbacterium sp. NPDC077184 TaxID=3154764 RepID=UPI00341F6E09